MSDLKNIQDIIAHHNRRLQELKKQQALYGISADPRVTIEIEEIEKKISELKLELERKPSSAESYQKHSKDKTDLQERAVTETSNPMKQFVQELTDLKNDFDINVRNKFSVGSGIMDCLAQHQSYKRFWEWREKYIIFLCNYDLRREVDRFRENTKGEFYVVDALRLSAETIFDDAWGRYIDSQIDRLIQDAQDGLLDRFLTNADRKK